METSLKMLNSIYIVPCRIEQLAQTMLMQEDAVRLAKKMLVLLLS